MLTMLTMSTLLNLHFFDLFVMRFVKTERQDTW
jgi:hypothetical protein